MPSAQAAAAVAASLQRLYGPLITVRYRDVSDPAVRAADAAVLDELAVEQLPLPALLLDGEILYAGTIDPLRVVATVAAALQARGHALPTK